MAKELLPPQIEVRENESIEGAIKRFRRMVEKDGIIKEARERQYFEKPSTKRHRAWQQRMRKLGGKS